MHFMSITSRIWVCVAISAGFVANFYSTVAISARSVATFTLTVAIFAGFVAIFYSTVAISAKSVATFTLTVSILQECSLLLVDLIYDLEHLAPST